MLRLLLDFLAWWRDELASFVPARVLRLFQGGADGIVAELSVDTLVLRRDDGAADGSDANSPGNSAGEPQVIARIAIAGGDFDDPDNIGAGGATAETRLQVEHALADAGAGSPAVRLTLPADRIYSRALALPAAAAEDLRQVVYYDLERRTPFKPDDVYFDVTATGVRPEAGEIDVRLHVVSRHELDSAVRRLAGLGLQAERVGIAGDGGAVDFLPPARRGKVPRGHVLTAVSFGLLAAVLFSAALFVPLEKERRRAARLAETLSALRTQAAVAARLEAERDKATERGRFIIDRKAERPPMVRLLADLSLLLPDDTWLIQLQAKQGGVTIQGHSPAASKLIETVERGHVFRNAEFKSRLTRSNRTGLERFHITFDLRVGDLKAGDMKAGAPKAGDPTGGDR